MVFFSRIYECGGFQLKQLNDLTNYGYKWNVR